jgi:hypothetical protein
MLGPRADRIAAPRPRRLAVRGEARRAERVRGRRCRSGRLPSRCRFKAANVLATTSRSTLDDSSRVARLWPLPSRSMSTSTNVDDDVDDDVDLDSRVGLDGSEAVPGRLTPPSPSTLPPLSLRRGSQHQIGRRPASMVGSTSYVAIDLDAQGQRSGRRRRSRCHRRGLALLDLVRRPAGGLRIIVEQSRLEAGPSPSVRHLLIDPSEETP